MSLDTSFSDSLFSELSETQALLTEDMDNLSYQLAEMEVDCLQPSQDQVVDASFLEEDELEVSTGYLSIEDEEFDFLLTEDDDLFDNIFEV